MALWTCYYVSRQNFVIKTTVTFEKFSLFARLEWSKPKSVHLSELVKNTSELQLTSFKACASSSSLSFKYFLIFSSFSINATWGIRFVRSAAHLREKVLPPEPIQKKGIRRAKSHTREPSEGHLHDTRLKLA